MRSLSENVGTFPVAALFSLLGARSLKEDYWMALTRDVPFSKYGEDEATVAAAGMTHMLAHPN